MTDTTSDTCPACGGIVNALQRRVEELETLLRKELAAAIREALVEAEQIVHGYATAYPEDIFIPPPLHEHGLTIDACSARALRAVLPNVERDIAALRGRA